MSNNNNTSEPADSMDDVTIGFQEKRSQEKEFEVNADVPAALNDVGAEYIGNELTDESNKPIQLDISIKYHSTDIQPKTSLQERENDHRSSEMMELSKMSSKKQHKMLSGVAMILQKFKRTSEFENSSDKVRGENGSSLRPQTSSQTMDDMAVSAKRKRASTEGSTSLVDLKNLGEQVPIRSNTKLPENAEFYAKLHPSYIFTECYKQNTVPKFGFSKKITDNNYVRSCKWSPNGEWLVTDSEDRIARIFNYLDGNLNEVTQAPHGGLIHDIQWHPYQSIFACTSKEQPIHCWNTDGKLVASFRGINSADELTSAYSLSFSLDGNSFFAGYCNYLRIFDMSRPGQQVDEIKTFTKNGIDTGQRGILSTITACPTFNGVYAVGSFCGTIGLYSLQTNSCDALIPTDISGITHLQYSQNGTYIYVGYRKSNYLHVYDVRMSSHLLDTFYRPAVTNQRIFFQADPYDRYLYSGSTSGKILIYDLKSEKSFSDRNRNGAAYDYEISVTKSCVCGLSLHPQQQMVAVTTGQRVFPQPLRHSHDSDSSDSNDENEAYTFSCDSSTLDNSLKLYCLPN